MLLIPPPHRPNYYKITDLINFIKILGFPSFILFGMPSYINQLKGWLPSYNDLVLCYRASEDGWASSIFHAGCDYKGATVTIIRVNTYRFGGYSDVSWGGKSIRTCNYVT